MSNQRKRNLTHEIMNLMTDTKQTNNNNNNNGRSVITPYKTTIISIIDIFGDSIKPAHIPQEKVDTVNTNRYIHAHV